jgi:hypothetical protein
LFICLVATRDMRLHNAGEASQEQYQHGTRSWSPSWAMRRHLRPSLASSRLRLPAVSATVWTCSYQDQLLSLTPPSPEAIGCSSVHYYNHWLFLIKTLRGLNYMQFYICRTNSMLLSLTSELTPVTFQSGVCCVSVDVCCVTGIYSIDLYTPMIPESVYERQNSVSPIVDNS